MILLNAEIYNQGFKTEKKLTEESNFITGSYYRFFPIFKCIV